MFSPGLAWVPPLVSRPSCISGFDGRAGAPHRRLQGFAMAMRETSRLVVAAADKVVISVSRSACRGSFSASGQACMLLSGALICRPSTACDGAGSEQNGKGQG